MMYGRKNELEYLEGLSKSNRSELLFIRGRRRVGKTEILRSFCQRDTSLRFYFMGYDDQSNKETLHRFAHLWDEFTHSTNLTNWKKDYLTWKNIFVEITKYIALRKKNICLVFDEIQWICKAQSGFLGALKEVWIDWEHSKKINIFLCGSSFRFFNLHTGGEKILRGLRTKGDLWIRPFTLKESHEYFFPNWDLLEVTFTYMLLGGIPYYLVQIDPQFGVIHAIHEALFTRSSIFLDEIEEILRLDFNKSGKLSAFKILKVIGLFGASLEDISEKSSIPISSAYDILEKLLLYDLIRIEKPTHCKTGNKKNQAKYKINDFYLNTYFALIDPWKEKIKATNPNDSKGPILFSSLLNSSKGLYINNFSGKAFEEFIRYALINFYTENNPPGFIKKLKLQNYQYEISSYWSQQSQIDLVIEDHNDRVSRILEIKWINGAISIPTLFKQVEEKNFPLLPGYSRINFLVLGKRNLKEKIQHSKFEEKILTIEDFV